MTVYTTYTWEPTHRSISDGSDIRKIDDPGYGDGSVTFLAENENGDRDEYLASEWLEIAPKRIAHSAQTALDLTEAYHVIYDVKDANLRLDAVRYAAYEALQKLAELMRALDIEVPDRYDNEGRTS